ncbi:MAG: hypothetical protein LBJ61_03065 [Deltaproteobacteria bacterium]|jgi:predicted RNA-binding Zn-ribbon protein involved in translation (DUF1610 family)|nr:hypothetical protein [Deltaproteobacteria bacterium]
MIAQFLWANNRSDIKCLLFSAFYEMGQFMFESAKCPKCNAELQVDSSQVQFFCSSCGTLVTRSGASSTPRPASAGLAGGQGRDARLVIKGNSLLSINLDEAGTSFQQALDINPTNYEAWLGLAGVILNTPYESNLDTVYDGHKPRLTFRMKNYAETDVSVDDIYSLHLNNPYIQRDKLKLDVTDRGPNTVKFILITELNEWCYALFKTFFVHLDITHGNTTLTTTYKHYSNQIGLLRSLQERITTFINPLDTYLTNALKFAPDSQKKQISASRNRFINIPLALIPNFIASTYEPKTTPVKRETKPKAIPAKPETEPRKLFAKPVTQAKEALAKPETEPRKLFAKSVTQPKEALAKAETEPRKLFAKPVTQPKEALAKAETEPSAGPETKPDKLSFCHIALAVYGSYEAPEVQALRKFRDEKLAPSRVGRFFIRIYYLAGCGVARTIGKSPKLRAATKTVLDFFVRRLSPKPKA